MGEIHCPSSLERFIERCYLSEIVIYLSEIEVLFFGNSTLALGRQQMGSRRTVGCPPMNSELSEYRTVSCLSRIVIVKIGIVFINGLLAIKNIEAYSILPFTLHLLL